MIVHFDNPPLVEVVCGVHFQYLSELLAPHYGVLWEKFKDEGFTDTREVPPLAPTSGTIAFSEVPPRPRIWFTTPDGQRLISDETILTSMMSTRPS